MVYEVKFHRFAQVEFEESILYYRNKKEGLDQLFFEYYISIEARLESNPFQFPLVQSGIRKATFQRFPYLIFFTLDRGYVCILSIVHQKRKPKNLLNRLKDTF